MYNGKKCLNQNLAFSAPNIFINIAYVCLDLRVKGWGIFVVVFIIIYYLFLKHIYYKHMHISHMNMTYNVQTSYNSNKMAI